MYLKINETSINLEKIANQMRVFGIEPDSNLTYESLRLIERISKTFITNASANLPIMSECEDAK